MVKSITIQIIEKQVEGALKQQKKYIGIELNPKFIQIAKSRLKPYEEQRRLDFL